MAYGVTSAHSLIGYCPPPPQVIAQNQAAVDASIRHLHLIPIPEAWAALPTPPVVVAEADRWGAAASGPVENAQGNREGGSLLAGQDSGSPNRLEFIERVARPMLALEGDRLPVSAFAPSRSSRGEGISGGKS